MASSSVVSCRWDWCRSTFTSIDALDAHVKRDHIWPMKPMPRAEIALMRRMDLQSLHSSASTESSIISRGLIAAVSCNKRPSTTETPKRPENKEFDTFAELSSPLPAHTPESLPASPAFEGLIRQDARSGLSAAVEMSKQTSQRRPPSQSSGSSQEVVEQQLTQDDVASQQLLLPDIQIENDLADAELLWPTDEEVDMHSTKETRDSHQPVSRESYPLGSSPDPARGLNFRTGSLNVPLRVNGSSANTSVDSQPSSVSQGSQQFVLQTQAPYPSQASSWSQTQ